MKTIKDITPAEKIQLSILFSLPIEEITKARCSYISQLHSCKDKTDRNNVPVQMKLSFEQWLKVWVDSGKWYERGRKKGQYCMCRRNDVGHYEIGNVYIDLASINSSTAPVYPRTDSSKELIRQRYLGKSRPKEVFEKGRQTKIQRGLYRAVVSDIDGMRFESVAEAARYYKLDPSTVSARCRKEIKGFRFA